MTDTSESSLGPKAAETARRLEVFLDYLVCLTRDAGHLLVGERFDPLLTPGERVLRDALTEFVALINRDAAAVRETVAWPQVARLLRGLGLDSPDGPGAVDE